MLVSDFEFAVLFEMLLVILRVCELMERAADDCLGLITLGDGDCFKTVFTLSDPAEPPHEVDKIGALHEQRGHPSIIIVCGRDMTVGACLRFAGKAIMYSRVAQFGQMWWATSNRMRDVRAKRDTAETVGRD